MAKDFVSAFQFLAVLAIQAEEVFSQKAERRSKAAEPRDQVLAVGPVTDIMLSFSVMQSLICLCGSV